MKLDKLIYQIIKYQNKIKMSAIRYDRIISDNGSGYVKLGYGNETFPRYVIPSIIGRPMLRASQKIGD